VFEDLRDLVEILNPIRGNWLCYIFWLSLPVDMLSAVMELLRSTTLAETF
jgi:hypothetical protein